MVLMFSENEFGIITKNIVQPTPQERSHDNKV